MPDDLFAVPRLARVYDDLDPLRHDLAPYLALVDRCAGRVVVDVGCGTGTFACQLALHGKAVVGIDPAPASLAVARTKTGAELVRWIESDATAIPELECDVVTMTGNVAQVFLDDDEWNQVLRSVHRALHPDGFMIFESREPSARAWETWSTTANPAVHDTVAEGRVECWTEVTDVTMPFVSFSHHYVFAADGAHLVSRSTLRFRSREENEDALEACGFRLTEVRDAPDRPGLENVYIARVS